MLFNNDFPLVGRSVNHILTKEDVILIKKKPKSIFASQREIASFSPFGRHIKVDKFLDGFSTIATLAISDLENIKGFNLAHEALHAHQLPISKMRSKENSIKMFYDLLKVEDNKPNPSMENVWNEFNAQQFPIDCTIIWEVQAHILSYMLYRGGVSASKIKMLEGQLKDDEEKRNCLERIERLGLSLDDYSENGYPYIKRYINEIVSHYLPNKYRNRASFLDRISSATEDILKLLALGKSHQEIAELIRKNYESIAAGNEWPEGSNNWSHYEFLGKEVFRILGNEKISDVQRTDLRNRWLNAGEIIREETEERLTKLRLIAVEEFEKIVNLE